MPILRNPKHEAFAHLVAKGASATDAYTSVGYKGKGAHASAHRLLQNAEISTRVAELQNNIVQAVTEKTAVSKAWVLEQLVDVIRKAKQDVEVYDRQGRPTGEYVFQGMVANKALELVGKELGMFVDRKDMTVRAVSLDQIPQDELLAAAAEAGLGIDASMAEGPSSVQ
jgi:phage terminase small subunit